MLVDASFLTNDKTNAPVRPRRGMTREIKSFVVSPFAFFQKMRQVLKKNAPFYQFFRLKIVITILLGSHLSYRNYF